MKVQSILVPKRLFTRAAAKHWVRTHNYKVSKFNETVSYYRYRQFNPTNKTYRLYTLPNGINLVLEL